MSRKALQVLAEVTLRAVSCPGVRLSAKDDIYLSVFFMGQFYQSEGLPAVFPLLFHEKMTFEKIFWQAVDAGDVAVLLECETVRIELVQLIPPDGDMLACFEEDARSFLFPEPKLVAPFSGVGREVLMTRAGHFPGIAPRLEFSTKTTITECPHGTEVSIYPKTLLAPVIKRNKKRSDIPRSTSPQPPEGRKSVWMDGERPSTAPPGPYISRSQLSIYSAPFHPSDWETTTSQRQVRERSECDSSYLEAYEPSDWHDGPGPSTFQLSYREPPQHSRKCHRTWEELHERVRGSSNNT